MCRLRHVEALHFYLCSVCAHLGVVKLWNLSGWTLYLLCGYRDLLHISSVTFMSVCRKCMYQVHKECPNTQEVKGIIGKKNGICQLYHFNPLIQTQCHLWLNDIRQTNNDRQVITHDDTPHPCYHLWRTHQLFVSPQSSFVTPICDPLT